MTVVKSYAELWRCASSTPHISVPLAGEAADEDPAAVFSSRVVGLASIEPQCLPILPMCHCCRRRIFDII